MRTIVIALIGATLVGLLMTKTARAQPTASAPPRRLTARDRAVPVAAVAPPTQEEHLTAAAIGA